MRIALVSQEYPPETAHGGIATQTFTKAQGLAALGHEVHVLSHSIDEKQRESCDGAVRVIRIPGFDAHLEIHTESVRWITWSAKVAAVLAALHGRAPLDLVEFPDWGAEGYIHLLNRTEWNYIPTVIQLHGPLVMLANALGWPSPDSEFYRAGTAMEGTCLRLADRVYSSSRCSREWCAKHYGLSEESIPVLNMGVDTVLFRPLGVPRAVEPTILFVGRVAESKGASVLLEAALRLASEFPELRLSLIGRCEPELGQALRERAAARGWPRLLELAGFVDREELPKHLCRAHVFASPSLYEGGPGFTCLEAMACGLPVIACSGSGGAEVIAHGDTGLLVPPGEPEALAVALRRLLASNAERAEMGERARRYVVEEADSRECLGRLEGFYRSVIVKEPVTRETGS